VGATKKTSVDLSVFNSSMGCSEGIYFLHDMLEGNDVYFHEPFLHSLYLRLIKYSMPSPYQLRQ
jgi:hypothetical protein